MREQTLSPSDKLVVDAKQRSEKKFNTVTHLLNSQRRDVRTRTSRVILEVKGTNNGKVTR